MIEPDVRKLIDKVGSRYTLVVAAAKRARMIIDGDEPRIELDFVASDRPVSVAARELAADKVICHLVS